MSTWVDSGGTQWRQVSGRWQKLDGEFWENSPLPSGGLERSSLPIPPIDNEEPSWPSGTSSIVPPTRLLREWTISVGSVASSAPGGLAQVTKSGTPPDAILNFVIPRGNDGPVGPTGPAGPTGNLAYEVVPQQLQNGTNATFALSNLIDTSKAVQVFRNGLLEVPGVGFSAAASSITFSTPPLVTDVVAVIYQKVQ